MTINPTSPQQAIITVFLMTEKGLHFLKHTAEKYKSMFSLIVVGNDKSIQKDYEEEIIQLCKDEGIPFVTKADFQGNISEYVFSISWRWLIKHPAEKLVVFHDSLLPKYRGFAPLVNSLVNGETEVGVTAIFGAAEFDTGDIIAQVGTTIRYPIKITAAIAQVNQCYLSAAEVVLAKMLRGERIEATPQRNADATYSVWRDEEDYLIDWSASAAQIRRLVDAVGHPYQGAYTKLDNKIVRILDTVEVSDVVVENRHYGKVLFVEDGNPVVICGSGMLKILDAHIEDGGAPDSLFPLRKFRMRFTS